MTQTYAQWLEDQSDITHRFVKHDGQKYVHVRDSQTTWVTTRSAWDSALTQTVRRDPDDDEFDADAYADFCAACEPGWTYGEGPTVAIEAAMDR
jgi:hypothetical protein